MAYAFRINQKVSRNITTGNCFSGLKYLKIKPPTAHQALLLESPLPILGCRTTSKTAVKKVAIVNIKVIKAKSSPAVRDIKPIIGTSDKNGLSRGRNSTDTNANPGGVQKRGASTHVRQTDASPICVPTDSKVSARCPTSCCSTGTGRDWQPRPSRRGTAPHRHFATATPTPPTGPPPPPGDAPGGTPPAGAGDSPPAQPPPGGSDGNPPDSSMVRSPMHVPGVAGSYAGALFSAASKQGLLDQVEQDMVKIRDTYIKDKILQNFLIAPDVPIPLKIEGMQALRKLNISDLSFNVLTTLAQNRRLSILPNIIAGYLEMMAAHRGIVSCEIISARPLKPAQKEKLQATLMKFLPGKQADIAEKLDPSLIGGFVVMLGERHIDMSMRKVVNKYESLISVPA